MISDTTTTATVEWRRVRDELPPDDVSVLAVVEDDSVKTVKQLTRTTPYEGWSTKDCDKSSERVWFDFVAYDDTGVEYPDSQVSWWCHLPTFPVETAT